MAELHDGMMDDVDAETVEHSARGLPHRGGMDDDDSHGDGGAAHAAFGMSASDAPAPEFPAVSSAAAGAAVGGPPVETRSVRVPPHRYTPLKENWEKVMRPVVEHMKLQIRMNTRSRCVEIRNSKFTESPDALQKAEDFVRAFMLGFDVEDAVALLRLQDLYVESFAVQDVRMLHGDHLARAIGRVAGQGGKTKHAIENASRTRIVVADDKIHILGAYGNVQVARDAVCALILGAPPGKIFNKMRQVSARLKAAH